MTEPKEMAFYLRKGGCTYPEIKMYLKIHHDLDVTPQTVRNWVEEILRGEL